MHKTFAIYSQETGALLDTPVDLSATARRLGLVPGGVAQSYLELNGTCVGRGCVAISWKLTGGPMVNLPVAYAAQGIVRCGTSD